MILALINIFLVFINSFSKIVFNKKNPKLNTDSAVSMVRYGKYLKYISFPWPPVVAVHDHKWYARALQNNGIYWLHKNYPYTQHSVMFQRLCNTLQTVQKTVPDRTRICHDDQ